MLIPILIIGGVRDFETLQPERRRTGRDGGGTTRLSTALVAGLVVFLTACGTNEAAEEPGSGPLVVATTTILGDVASEIVGEDGEVEVLMPVGADPHDFQASARQAERLREADMVIANGLGLEEGLLGVLESVESEGGTVLEVAELADPIPFAEGPGHADHDDVEVDEDHGGEDPHFWHDPTRMAAVVAVIAEHLAEVDGSVDWTASGAAYIANLEELDAEIVTTFEDIPPTNRKLVTNHESLGYLAERYGFEVIGVVVPGGSTLAEPSPAHLAELVELLRTEGVTSLFVEDTDAADLADTVAAELGAAVTVHELHSDSLGEPGTEAETYLGMLRSNAAVIADALS